MLIYVLLCVSAAFAQEAGLQVNTTQGLIEGLRAPDGDYHAFYGIPYAGATSGDNRFKAPTPPIPFPGLFHAMDSNILCAQPSTRGLIGIENCLTLNVFTSNVTTPKPVFVWLNAEEYTTANNQLYSFRRLVEQGIVVVSLNFRLSIFGFLCLGVEEAPGNAGLKDVIQGLKWINSNIAAFGGDRNNVILIGHGSGAAIVDLITLSPQSNNLVHKAIAISGSGLAPWAVAYEPISYAQTFATKLNYTNKTPAELARLLKTTDVNVLGSALNDFVYPNNSILFAPCVENPNVYPNETVIADAPINIIRSGNYSHIPYIAAYTNREGTLRAREAAFDQWLDQMQSNFSNFLQVDLNFGTNATNMAQSIRNFYFSNAAISMATIEDFLDYQGDTLILVSAIRGARERGATSRSEVRLMEFAYMGTLNSDWSYTQIPLKGVRHGGILNYLFDFDLRPIIDEAARNATVGRFVAFANTGTPTVTGTTAWPAVTTQALNYLYCSGGNGDVVNTTTAYFEEARFNPHTTRMTFWNNIYTTYYQAPRPSSATKVLSFAFIVMFCQLFVRLF